MKRLIRNLLATLYGVPTSHLRYSGRTRTWYIGNENCPLELGNDAYDVSLATYRNLAKSVGIVYIANHYATNIVR
jgi:hypothetical protein